MTNGEQIESFLHEVAAAPQSVLLLDYDGTLAPFSIHRDHALPYTGVTSLLEAIVDSGRTRLVIVTGRDAHQIGPLLNLHPSPEIWGAHSLQRLRPDGVCEMPEIPSHVKEALDEAGSWLEYQGLEELAEMKPGGIAVHWRMLTQRAISELRSRILPGWFQLARRNSLKVLEFDGGVELGMAGVNKGNAVRTMLSEVEAHVPVAYLGDDTTDEYAFQALAGRGLTILVRPAPRRTSAEAWLRPPEELLDFLSRWEDATQTATELGHSEWPLIARNHGHD
jgi:trehalose 6-phosphate phosphatase